MREKFKKIVFIFCGIITFCFFRGYIQLKGEDLIYSLDKDRVSSLLHEINEQKKVIAILKEKLEIALKDKQELSKALEEANEKIIELQTQLHKDYINTYPTDKEEENVSKDILEDFVRILDKENKDIEELSKLIKDIIDKYSKLPKVPSSR
ncbi:MAG: hypothetical protein NC822_05860 [Candidatus Omnitrophica bacterium]|nr:hypothetical protein [Candidatus Omnitrophota bacterium]MCM8826418.1 hypothetical protein [Candidatus Omnitrophota bacterium]